MRRAAIERPRVLRVWREHLRDHLRSPVGIDCICEFQPGRFRKGQRVGGCGNARCYLCHAGKILGDPDAQRARSNISYAEWLDELGWNRPRWRLRS